MARVNVEEWAFGDVRAHRVSKTLKIEAALVLGRMLYVWHDSQELLRTSGTRDEILSWTRMDLGEEADRFFDALVTVGYLTKTDSRGTPVQYEIQGNKTQIATRVSNITRGKKGGRATQEKWKKIKNEFKNSSLTQGLERSGRHASALASNPIQSNPIQLNSEQPNLLFSEAPETARRVRGVPDPLKVETGPTWEAYKNAYYDRHGHEPKRNAKVNSNIKSFVQRLGAEDAPRVAEFYVRHNKSFYVEKLHDVGPMLVDAEALYSQWKRGAQMTRAQANLIDRTQTNANVFGELALRIERENRETHESNEKNQKPEDHEAPWADV